MTSLLLGITGCVAIVAIYFLWVRRLLVKTPEQAKAPETHG